MPSPVDVDYGEGAYALRTQRHVHVLNPPSSRRSINAAMLNQETIQETINEAILDKGVFDEMAFAQVSR